MSEIRVGNLLRIRWETRKAGPGGLLGTKQARKGENHPDRRHRANQRHRPCGIRIRHNTKMALMAFVGPRLAPALADAIRQPTDGPTICSRSNFIAATKGSCKSFAFRARFLAWLGMTRVTNIFQHPLKVRVADGSGLPPEHWRAQSKSRPQKRLCSAH